MAKSVAQAPARVRQLGLKMLSAFISERMRSLIIVTIDLREKVPEEKAAT